MMKRAFKSNNSININQQMFAVDVFRRFAAQNTSENNVHCGLDVPENKALRVTSFPSEIVHT